jgi:hypothetical protein
MWGARELIPICDARLSNRLEFQMTDWAVMRWGDVALDFIPEL